MNFRDKLSPSGPKRLLALDGGGIRGLISIEVLAAMEALLQRRLNRGDDFVLADYFDYIAGTSTGGIIAACLAWGMRVADVREFYQANGKTMFAKSSWLKRILHKYDRSPLAAKLSEVFSENGVPVLLGAERLKTLLMLVLRNSTTDSPWPLSNNPEAKYNDTTRDDCNLNIPLWQLVRASTAAPTYFPPEEFSVGDKKFTFVDGGITTFNNPALQLFLMASLPEYRLTWPTGENKLLLVSVGTGVSPEANENLSARKMNLLYNAKSLPSALMYAALVQQDLLCRVMGKCLAGGDLDREVRDLRWTANSPAKQFTYVRYNAELTRAGLNDLGLAALDPKQVQALDSLQYMSELAQVGRAVGSTIKDEHFPEVFNC